jgi:hypothetical protein
VNSKPPKRLRPKSEEGSLEPIDIAAWRRKLAPLYSEPFLADRSGPEIIELVRALGRLGVELPVARETRSVRHRTADERARKFLEEAVAIEQTSAQEAGTPVLDSSGTINGMVVVLRDASSEVRRDQDLTHRANHDALTGLQNRAAFARHLAEVFGRSRMRDRPAVLLALDLDRFKALNDAAGHAAGDAALINVAQVCRATVRSSDIVAGWAATNSPSFSTIARASAPMCLDRNCFAL